MQEDWTTGRYSRLRGTLTKRQLEDAVTMACPKSGWQTLLFPHANYLYCVFFLTQVPPTGFAGGVDVRQIRHGPLAVVGSQFKGAQPQRPTVDKEAFSIVGGCSRRE